MLGIKSRFLALISSVLFLLIVKYATDYGAGVLPETLQLLFGVSIPIAGGLIVLCSASLLGSLPDGERESPAFFLLRRISDDPTRNFFLGFLASAYLNLIRPSMATNVPFLPYIEWVSIGLTVYMMYSMTRSPSEQFDVGSEDQNWKRHAQEITRETGRDLIRTKEVMQQFIDSAVKEPLLVYLTLYLQRLGKTEEEILRTLGPIIHYQTPRSSFFTFVRTKGKIVTKNAEVREHLLTALLEEIDRMRS